MLREFGRRRFVLALVKPSHGDGQGCVIRRAQSLDAALAPVPDDDDETREMFGSESARTDVSAKPRLDGVRSGRSAQADAA
jgi:hypothetical protein